MSSWLGASTELEKLTAGLRDQRERWNQHEPKTRADLLGSERAATRRRAEREAGRQPAPACVVDHFAHLRVVALAGITHVHRQVAVAEEQHVQAIDPTDVFQVAKA